MNTLPRAASRDSAPASNYILVVDDDPTIGQIVCEALGWEGYSAAWATNGAVALTRLQNDPPALVLLDMKMPVLDGWGFARALAKQGIRVPIVVMTAASDAQRWADEINADGCLPKPFDLDDLFSVVHQYVGLSN